MGFDGVLLTSLNLHTQYEPIYFQRKRIIAFDSNPDSHTGSGLLQNWIIGWKAKSNREDYKTEYKIALYVHPDGAIGFEVTH